MTDDERMDRARRIREMREGGRQNEGTAPDESADAGPSDGPEDAAESETGSTDSASADSSATVDETDDPAAGDDTVGEDESTDGSDTVGDDESTDETGTDDEADGGMHVPGAEVGDVDVDVAEMAEQAGLETADIDPDAGDANTDADAAAAPAGVGAEAEAQTSEETRVLEFTLGEERYCLDIEYVEEIVKRETVTRVPNTPTFVEGVVDLRGQITTILDPKVPLDIDSEGSKDLIVVFDPDEFEEQGAIGWIVDDVRKVAPITEDEVNESPTEDDHINGVVDRDDEFVIWTEPDVAIEEASG